MYNWAKREIELAKENEKEDLEKGEFDYGGACYDSALKAFESLTKDGHSGFSIGLTKHILVRLIEGKPLTPIEDTEDVWNFIHYDKEDNCGQYQSKRMSSLFKYVYADETVKYKDIDSNYCVDINTRSTYHSGLVQNVVDAMYPITMPYIPADKPIKIYCEDFLTDIKNGDFDTVGVLYLITPDDTKVDINRYFKEDEKGADWIEIGLEEYTERYRKFFYLPLTQ
jgi:hypothetical protein